MKEEKRKLTWAQTTCLTSFGPAFVHAAFPLCYKEVVEVMAIVIMDVEVVVVVIGSCVVGVVECG